MTITREPRTREDRKQVLRSPPRPLLVADWTDAVFVHFAIDPRVLQPHVPFELDLYEGKAYVSLVAFTQERLRPRVGGRLSATLSAPLATHHFLNVRTYVRVGEQRGIYFLCEWIPNRLAVLLGPTLYGLPYRLARMHYRCDRGGGFASHEISAGDRLAFDARWDPTTCVPVHPSTLDEFLLERYVAFTFCNGTARRFHVWHEPWPQCAARATMHATELLARTGLPPAIWKPVRANYTPGVHDVLLSGPLRVLPTPRPQRSAAPSPPCPSRIAEWLPLLILPLLVIFFARALPAWQFMWLLALSLYFGCKWKTWWPEFVSGRARAARSLGYLLAWHGMDARTFFDSSRMAEAPAAHEWVEATARTVAGALLLWAICRLIPPIHPLLVGWVGMIGFISMLHFGLFALLSVIWRSAGIDAQPLMNRPLAATSLADFWGRRWNTAFHQLAHAMVFRPLRRALGPSGAMLGAFFVSGLVHDLIISIPARGGYGLPTVYFMLQGLGILLERRIARRQWLMFLFTLGPVFLLFHPPFVTRVILPFLASIRAIRFGGTQ